MLLPFWVNAQAQTEYNRKGDEAFKIKDYRTALLWYEEGVSNCDRYSIDQLTSIYMAEPAMQISMRVVMGRCFTCLNNQAMSNRDTLAIKKLIDYYSVGIGVQKNEAAANNLKEQLDQLRTPVTVVIPPPIPKDRMQFWVGYHASMIAPVGVQVGGMGKSIGWYVRFHSNLIFQDTQYNGEVIRQSGEQNVLRIRQLDAENTMYRVTGNVKESCLMGSVGIMYKALPAIHVSAGVGYWDRKYTREFIHVNDKGSDIPPSGWVKDDKSSINGITIDLDGTYIFSGKFYGTIGGSLLSFKYIYPTIGVGVIF
jgi:hypothetical protein